MEGFGHRIVRIHAGEGRLTSHAAAGHEDHNLTMKVLILKVLLGVAIGIAIIGVFVLFGHSATPV